MAQRFSGRERIASDAYYTPAWCTEALLRHIPVMNAVVWEPAAGIGKISSVLARHGARVFSSDVNAHENLDEVGSFFDVLGPKFCMGIITNPPYGPRGDNAEKFCRTALENVRATRGFVAMLLKVDFDSAKTRYDLFADNPAFAMKLVLTDRIVWFDPKPGDASPSENHAWYYWNYHHQGPAQIRYAGAPADVLSDIRAKRSKRSTKVNYRQLKQAASESSYAATGTLNDPIPVPGKKPKAL